MSNCYCLPGKAGGTPIALGSRLPAPQWRRMGRRARFYRLVDFAVGTMRVTTIVSRTK
jgi:hypothetical protein